MSLLPFSYIPNYTYSSGWDRFALKYIHLLQPDTVYTLTKKMMYSILRDYVDTKNKDIKVLDVNCGTGNDFDYFFEQGWSVVGTDGSKGMLNLAAEKYAQKITDGQLRLFVGHLENWQEADLGQQKFDLIYSITGGFSYINDRELLRLNTILANLLQPNGYLIVANLNTFCLMESLYYWYKGMGAQKDRRFKKSIDVDIEGELLKMYLRDHKKLKEIYANSFDVLAQRPLMSVTPPYQCGMSPSKSVLKFFEWCELGLMRANFPVQWSDQVVTVCKRKDA